jgi:hypothetical protein
VQWESGRVAKVWQIVRHHLRSAPGAGARRYFWGV